MSFGNEMRGRINRYRFTRRSFVSAVLRAAVALNDSRDVEPQAIIGKFLFRGGEAAVALARQLNRAAFADIGESWSFLSLEAGTRREAEKTIRELTGVVCVSGRLRDEMLELGADPNRVIIAPNDVDLDRFHRIDKDSARKQLGLPLDKKIAVFAGHFVERKGPLRVAEALRILGPTYTGVFLGRGGQVPSGDHILFAGSVPNESVPIWLNAADVFVLPTLREGHCNAINEAVACGLPVVSSDIDDVRCQVDDAYSILVDPTSPSAISKAIAAVCGDEKRNTEMGDAAYKFAHAPERRGRADTILDFMASLI